MSHVTDGADATLPDQQTGPAVAGWSASLPQTAVAAATTTETLPSPPTAVRDEPAASFPSKPHRAELPASPLSAPAAHPSAPAPAAARAAPDRLASMDDTPPPAPTAAPPAGAATSPATPALPLPRRKPDWLTSSAIPPPPSRRPAWLLRRAQERAAARRKARPTPIEPATADVAPEALRRESLFTGLGRATP